MDIWNQRTRESKYDNQDEAEPDNTNNSKFLVHLLFLIHSNYS